MGEPPQPGRKAIAANIAIPYAMRVAYFLAEGFRIIIRKNKAMPEVSRNVDRGEGRIAERAATLKVPLAGAVAASCVTEIVMTVVALVPESVRAGGANSQK